MILGSLSHDVSSPLAHPPLQVCCERDGQGEVFIVDPGNPTEIKQTFLATKSAIICIEFVPEGGGCDIKMSNMQGSGQSGGPDCQSS